MAIVYRYGHNLYINLTNRCPCDCTFCYRNLNDGIGDAENLWLEREPEADEVVDAVSEYDLDEIKEIVYCGYGEPTERLEVLLESAKVLKERTGKKIRLDTNGLGSVINGKDILPALGEVLDSISVSLNASCSEEYDELCRPEVEDAYGHILVFIMNAKQYIPHVAVSVVGGTISDNSMRICQEYADEVGVKFRVRG